MIIWRYIFQSVTFLHIESLQLSHSLLQQTLFPIVNIRRLRLWEEYFLTFDPTHMTQQGQAEEHSMTHSVSDRPKVNYCCANYEGGNYAKHNMGRIFLYSWNNFL